jgi:hypothetical protein
MVEVLVHQKVFGILFWQMYHSIFANPIWQLTLTTKYWILGSEYETQAQLLVVKPQILVTSHQTASIPLIHIPENPILRHGSGILGEGFTIQYFPAYDWSSGTTEICQSCPEWAAWILIKPTLTSCDWLWINQSSPGVPQEQQITHQSACTPVHSALYLVV